MAKNPKLLNIFKFSFPDSVWNDPMFTGITDTELEDLLEFVAKKDITYLTPEESYGVFLLAKREIFWKLSTSTAPLYGIEVDGTKVNKNQRFEHYLELIVQCDLEIKRYQESGSASTVSVGEVFLNNRHFDMRNYENTPIPIVYLNIDKTYSDKVEISWECEQVAKFYNYIIYINNNIIIDNYIDKGLGNTFNIATQDSTKVATIFDRHQTKYRVEGLTPNTDYHIALVCLNANTVYGYKELTFKTEV